jgi:hypothetical protein
MTTFTLQDLYTPTTEGKSAIMDTPTPTHLTETPEEKEYMDTLMKMDVLDAVAKVGQDMANSKVENTSTKPSVEQLAQQLTQSFALLIQAITDLKQEQPVSSSVGGDLMQTVDTVLEEAD